MGNSNSLINVEGLSSEEVRRLEKRFQKLDLDSSGTISVGEFLSVPELNENPLVQRIVDVLDSDQSGEVDFKEFIIGLYNFVEHDQSNDNENKIRFLFNIYDMDKDGFIANKELFKVLKMMVGKNLTNDQLREIVNRTILYLDKDIDGKISFEEFKRLVLANSNLSTIPKQMVVHLDDI